MRRAVPRVHRALTGMASIRRRFAACTARAAFEEIAPFIFGYGK